MVTLKKWLAGCAAALLTCLCCALPAAAQRQFAECNERCMVYDLQDVLSASEEQEVNGYIRDVCNEMDMYFAVVIVGPQNMDFSSDWEVENYADDLYNDMFNPEAGVDTDGALLVLNNSSMYDYLTTSGAGQFYFTNSDSNNRVFDMLEDITPKLKAENYAGAIKQFCDLLAECYDQGVPYNYYIYDDVNGYGTLDSNGVVQYSDHKPVPLLLLLGGSIIVGLITAFITYFSIKHHYRFKSAVSPTNYICKNNTVMHEQTDTFLREYTSKTRIQSSSGGGGGRGGGHSHSRGGHSHGGGGHHR